MEMLEWCTSSTNNKDSDIRARAGGTAADMNKFNYIYGIRLAHLVLSHLENLSSTLQNPDQGQNLKRDPTSKFQKCVIWVELWFISILE